MADEQSQERGTTVQVGAIECYLAGAGGTARRPGVVVIHEAFGLTDDIRAIADRFAAEGYCALAVDLFSHDASRRMCMVRVMTSMMINPQTSFSLTDLDNAVTYLRARPDVDAARIGVIGFCMGGSFALALAVHNSEVHAVSAFYGGNPRPLDLLERACPVAASYGKQDRIFAPQGRRLAQALREYEIPHDVKIYAGAGHSFFNETRSSYRPEAAADSWQRTLDFFARHLAPQAPA